MGNAALGLLGLAKKAGKLEIGEEPVGIVCRTKTARLVAVAADAAENTLRRVEHFAAEGVPRVKTPFSKEEMGWALGRKTCAMVAFTDGGLAASFVRHLAQADRETYGELAAVLDTKAAKLQARRKEKRERAGQTPPTAKK